MKRLFFTSLLVVFSVICTVYNVLAQEDADTDSSLKEAVINLSDSPVDTGAVDTGSVTLDSTAVNVDDSESGSLIDSDSSGLVDLDSSGLVDSDSSGLIDLDSSIDTDTQNSVKKPVVPLKSEIPKNRMPDLKVTLTPKTVAIGQKAVWSVEAVKKDSKDRIIVSAVKFDGLEIVSRYVNNSDISNVKTDKTDSDNGIKPDTVYAAGLISFDEGSFDIPPQKLTVVDKDGDISEVMTKGFTLKVKSLIANEPEPKLKEDKGSGEVVMEKDYTAVYIAAALGGILLIVLLTLLGRKLWLMRRPRPEAPPPPPRPAEEIALEKLSALKDAQYLNEGMHKEFHLKLSEAVREYLGNRYSFDSLERSTFELVGELKIKKIKRELYLEIVKLLEDTDLVKFAKYIPDIGESRALLDDAFRIVEVTTKEALQAESKEQLKSDDHPDTGSDSDAKQGEEGK